MAVPRWRCWPAAIFGKDIDWAAFGGTTNTPRALIYPGLRRVIGGDQREIGRKSIDIERCRENCIVLYNVRMVTG